MERLRKFPVLFLLTLCAVLAMTGTARAAEGYSVRGVDVNRENGTATVSLTAAGDCTLFAGVYDGDGRFVSFVSESVTGAEEEQTKTVTFPGGIAEDTSVSAFLSGTGNTPLCDKATGYDGNVYAILYDDGTMVFQHGDTPESGRTATEKWLVDLAGYEWDYYTFKSVPWGDFSDSIQKVLITERIKPLSTAYWFLGFNNMITIDCSGLDTCYVTDMLWMFYDCSKLTSLDLSTFHTENTASMLSMFDGCSNLKTIYASDFFIVPAGDSSEKMFHWCEALVGGSGTHYDENHTDGEYARIDTPDAPGYFTRKPAA